MKTRLFALLLLLAGVPAVAQVSEPAEKLVPLGSNPIQAAEAMHRASRMMTPLVDTIPLPSQGLRDNFEYDSHRPDTALWNVTLNPGVFVNRTWAISPLNVGVCTFDGLDYLGQPYNFNAVPNSSGPCDQLTSRYIDLSGYSVADSVYLSFWYQAQGFGYAPNTQDSLILDYNTPSWNPNQSTTVWKTMWYSEGFVPADSGWTQVLLKLDSASYFAKGFRFRFRNYASQCGSNDHWHIDEVYLKAGRTYNDTLIKEASFVYEMPSFLKDYQAMPWDHYKPAVHMAGDVNIQLRNNDNIARNITYTYDVLTESGSLIYHYPGGADNLAPVWNSGYSAYQPHANPDVYPAMFGTGFPQPSDTETYIVRHKLKDGSRTDSIDFQQKFYNYYAYDDGTAEVGYSLYGANASLAYQYKMENTNNPDTLVAVQMYFLPVMDVPNLDVRQWNLCVWKNDGPLGVPGTLIYRQRTQQIQHAYETPDRFVTYTIDSGLVVLQPGQTYYIGWQQYAADRMYIGYDLNTNHADKVYYNTNGNWYPSIFTGSIMMRPVFGDVYPHYIDVSGVQEHSYTEGFNLYPNPANTTVTIDVPATVQNPRATILDLSGREVSASVSLSGNKTLDVSELPAGMYFVQVRDENGTMIGTQRLLITR